jgi:imidazolonepropionase-like amidohydrolase
MKNTGATILFAAIAVAGGSPLGSVAQEVEDRRRFLEPTTRTSDDPRRVPLPEEDEPTALATVFRGGRIFDALSGVSRDASIVVHGRRIVSILPKGAQDWPADADVVDVSGHTVLPGLIDLHTHLSYWLPEDAPDVRYQVSQRTLLGAERLRYYIEAGITSVRDVASHDEIPFTLKRWVAEGRIPGPRVFAAGHLITATGGHGAEGMTREEAHRFGVRVAIGPKDWREAVREQFNRGADLIKLASHYSRDEVRAAVDEAHALGLRVTVDAETFYIDWALDAGVDSIEHPLPRTDDALRRMSDDGVYAVPTLIPYSIIIDENGGYWGSTSRRFTMTKATNMEMLRRMKAEGVRMGIGTDLVIAWYRYLPTAYYEELAAFHEVGYSASEVLVAATRTGAEILDMSDKLGTLEVGKLADLLIVEGRPDERLSDLENVRWVLRDGAMVVEDGRVVVPRHEPLDRPRGPEDSSGPTWPPRGRF